jgi:hypothetical protein
MYPFFALTPPRSYYPIRVFDDVTKKWVRALYVAELHVIAERYAQWEIIGPPEIRTGSSAGSFNPFRPPVEHLPPVEEPQPEKEPPEREPPDNEPHNPPVEEPTVEDGLVLEETERFLLLLFLRRYVIYCARRRRFAAMNGAAKLFAEGRASEQAATSINAAA